MKENKGLYIGYLFVIGVVFYLMNVFTPLSSDDWHYNFIFGTHTQIKNIGDIFNSLYIHYLGNNGRFVPHFFVQLFDGLLGKAVFNVVNTLVFLLFLYLMSYTLRKEYKSFYVSTSLTLFLIFFFIPAFSICFLWMSGACNYLWVAVLLLIFNLLLENNFKNSASYPLLFVIGLLCGWTNEALVIGLGMGYLVYYTIHWRELNTARLFLLAGFFMGMLFLVLAPGSVSRALDKGHITFGIKDTMLNMLAALLRMDNIIFFPLLIAIMLIMYLFKRERIKGFLSTNVIWVTAICVSFLFILWTRHDSGHSRFGFELFSMILILKIIYEHISKRIVPALCNIAVVLCTIFVLHLSYLNYMEYNNCLAQIEEKEDGIVLTNSVRCLPYFERFLVFFKPAESSEWYSPYDNTISNRYQKDLCFIPQRLYEDIIASPERYRSFDLTTNEPYYVKALDCDKVGRVMMKLYQTNYDALPIYLRPFADKMKRYSANEVEVMAYAVVKVNDNPYIIVNKNQMVDARLKEIVVE